MNYLAHAFLAQSEGALFRLGNLMADHIKGPADSIADHLSAQDTESLAEILQGIRYHRRIDHRVDHFPQVQALRERFLPRYRRYAGIVLDMAWDHQLASGWHSFARGSLSDFAGEQYRLLRQYRSIQPASMQQMVHYMVKHNWLEAYAGKQQIRRSLAGMAQRMRRQNQLAEAYTEMERLGDLLQETFPVLLHDLQQEPFRLSEPVKGL